jgi:hypothetical protein
MSFSFATLLGPTDQSLTAMIISSDRVTIAAGQVTGRQHQVSIHG